MFPGNVNPDGIRSFPFEVAVDTSELWSRINMPPNMMTDLRHWNVLRAHFAVRSLPMRRDRHLRLFCKTSQGNVNNERMKGRYDKNCDVIRTKTMYIKLRKLLLEVK